MLFLGVISDFKMFVKSLIIIINYKVLIIGEIKLNLKQINMQMNITWETFQAFVISSSIYRTGIPVQFCQSAWHSFNNTTSHKWRKKDAKAAFVP